MNKIGCPICKYYQFDGNCTAFPDGIPMMFLSGEKHHTERTKFQENDLVFEWISPEEQGKRRAEAIERHKKVAVQNQGLRTILDPFFNLGINKNPQLKAIEITIDHLQPRSLGGSDTEENLALACNRCNQNRYNFVVGRDLETSTILPLFNPRNQLWQEHFTWSIDATKVIGTTAIGRATCDRLDMNDDKYKGERSICEARALWLEAGWHPPANDPRQLEV